MLKFPKERKEFSIFKRLNTPIKIQDFLNSIPFNFEKNGETSSSPLMSLENKKIHCFEGAVLAASIFWYHGEKPLLLDLETTSDDISHAVTLFKRNGYWGAISKTNHSVLRYRDPVYKTVRELALSYFNEYFLDNGKKTLRSYTDPFDLSRFGTNWLTSKEDIWFIVDELNEARHYKIFKKDMYPLRKADKIEILAGKIIQQKKK